MKFPTPASTPAKPKPVPAIGWAGLIAGTLDLSFAMVWFGIHGKSPYVLLKFIAGGALGSGAAEGGPGTAVLGLAFHFCISFGAAALYYAGSRKISFLNRHAWISGPVYGLLVYEFMHLVVLPLSAYHRPVVAPPLLVPDVLSHLFFVGLAVALIVRRYSGPMSTVASQESTTPDFKRVQ